MTDDIMFDNDLQIESDTGSPKRTCHMLGAVSNSMTVESVLP